MGGGWRCVVGVGVSWEGWRCVERVEVCGGRNGGVWWEGGGVWEGWRCMCGGRDGGVCEGVKCVGWMEVCGRDGGVWVEWCGRGKMCGLGR